MWFTTVKGHSNAHRHPDFEASRTRLSVSLGVLTWYRNPELACFDRDSPPKVLFLNGGGWSRVPWPLSEASPTVRGDLGKRPDDREGSLSDQI